MDYRKLGRSGLSVSRFSLGAMTFGAGGTGVWQHIAGLELAAVRDLVAQAADAGVNLIDTADAYSQGRSEALVGEALADRGTAAAGMLVATKVRLRTGPGPDDVGLGRGHIIRSIEASLTRLRRDHIDLLQAHDWDPTTPLEETLRAFDDLVRAGKVRYVGACNFTAAQLTRAAGLCQAMGLAPLVSNQAYYGLAGRDLEWEVVPAARELGVGLMVWSPLAGGYLSGKYTPEPGPGGPASTAGEGRRASLDFPPVDRPRADAIVAVLREIGRAHDASPARIALAWTLAQPGIDSIAIGAKSAAQLQDNLAAAEIALDPAELQRLDQVSRVPAPYPYWMQAFHNRDLAMPAK